jgi:class 3 adenylate cyclase/TolB-like protein/cytochrome c-type biogenesis protein CcmH/NrfG
MSETNNVEQLSEEGTRRLAAIMFTDIFGFSKKMQKDEAATLRLLRIHNEMMRTAIAKHQGREIKTIGDAFLVDFASVLNATQCAVEIQQTFLAYNNTKPNDEKIIIRIGVHLGDVVETKNDIFGDGVNIANRIQSMAEPGGVNISGSVYEQVKNKLDIRVLKLGVPQLKNIKEAIQVYQVLIVPSAKTQSKFATNIIVAKSILSRKTTKRNLVVAVLLCGIAIGALYYFTKPAPQKNSIAVLPFENIGDTTTTYIADGLTDEIIDRLSQLHNALVISHASSFFYKGKNIPVEQIATELGVYYVLTGNLRRYGDKIKVNAQLKKSDEQTPTWNETYEIPQGNILSLQSQIAQQVAERLHLEFSEQERSVSPKVYDLYLRGIFEKQKHKKENNDIAIAHFTKAIELDSQFARGYFELANAQLLNYDWGWDKNEAWFNEAEKNCQHALALDSTLGSAYGVLGRIAIARGKRNEGITLLQKAIALNPNDMTSFTMLGNEIAFNQANPVTGITYFIRAKEIEPTNVINIVNTSAVYAMLRNFPEAIQGLQKALTVEPSNDWAWLNLGVFYTKVLEFQKADSAYTTSLKLNPTNSESREYLGELKLAQKKFSDAEILLSEGLQLDPFNYHFLYILGIAQFYNSKTLDASNSWKKGIALAKNDVKRNAQLGEPKIYVALFGARLQRKEESLAFAQQCFQEDSLNSDVYLGLSRVYAIMGERKQMVSWFQRATEKNQEFDEAFIKTSLDFEKFRNDAELLSLAQK